MPPASLLAYLGPLLYGARCWLRATRRDPAYYEPDLIA